MKQLKKWTALLLALMLMITLVPWTAKAEFTQPTGTITVKGVEDGATVKAYRLTKAVFDTNGNFLRYENVVDKAFADPQKPTNADWSKLIKKPVGELGTAAIDLNGNNANGYTVAKQEAGLYMILVTSSKGMVYNPMIVGLSYAKDANGQKVTGGEIEVGQGIGKSFTLDTKSDIQVILYAKKSEVPLSKTTTDPSPEDQSSPDSNKGNGLGLNEKPSFKITTTIPSYPTTDKELMFTITDTLDPGLTPPQASEITVTKAVTDPQGIVKQVAIPKDAATITVKEQVITIKFTDTYLKGLNGQSQDLTITYKATLNDKATVNFAANKNKVVVEYTNDPKNGGTSTKEDITYHYTFDIDGLLNGKDSETSHEITKHGKVIEGETKWFTKNSGLAGAEFTLYSGDPTGKKIVEGKKLNELGADEVLKYQTVTTTDDGRMNFKKLDEGVYYIKETKAPNGYSLNENVYQVVITADYNTNGTLKSYSIAIKDTTKGTTATTTFTAQNEKTAPDTKDNPGAKQDGVITEKDGPTLIENTTIPGLPSTGGMGTYLFTGIGVALLAGAAVVVTVLRKKNGQTTR